MSTATRRPRLSRPSSAASISTTAAPRPARARRVSRGRVELILHEGRKHQVKRMLAAVGHPVRRLQRSRYGPLTAEGLEPGEWRELTPAELAALRAEPGG